jgi:hypothetical protein
MWLITVLKKVVGAAVFLFGLLVSLSLALAVLMGLAGAVTDEGMDSDLIIAPVFCMLLFGFPCLWVGWKWMGVSFTLFAKARTGTRTGTIFFASVGARAGASTSQSACHGCDSEPSASNPGTTSNSRPPSLSALRDDNPGIGTAM